MEAVLTKNLPSQSSDPAPKLTDANQIALKSWEIFERINAIVTLGMAKLYKTTDCDSCVSSPEELAFKKDLGICISNLGITPAMLATDIEARTVSGYIYPDAPYGSSTQSVEEEVLNWDAWIKTSPRPSRIIRAKIERVGRGKPTPAEDPWA